MKPFVVLVTLVGLASCAQLPSNLKRCSRSDAKYNDCLKDAIQDAFPKMANGISELSVPPLEPLHIPSATIGQGTGPVNVEQKYKNINIHDLATSKIVDLETSKNDNKINFNIKISAPQYVLKADYDFNGRILLLPIVGVGKCAITLSEVETDLMMVGEKFEKKGKIHMKIKDMKITLKPKKVTFNFENLFNGEKRLADEMHKVLNENWKEVFDDVKGGYEKLLESIGKVISNNIFNKVPYDDIFMP